MINTVILDLVNDTKKSVDLAVKSMMESNPAAFPTETVYGIGAPIFDENAVLKVFDIKQRNRSNPLSAHVSSLEHIEFLCENIPDEFYKLSEKFLPGPLALVLRRKSTVSELVSGSLQTLSIRYPDNKYFLVLADELGQPIAATSANQTGRPSPNNAQSVFEDLNGKVKYILDGGRCRYSVESTVLSLVESKPVLYRPGVITQQAIENVLGYKIYSADKQLSVYKPVSEFSAIKSSFKLYSSDSIGKINSFAKEHIGKTMVLTSREQLNNIDCENKFELSAGNLFEILREAEKDKFDAVVILDDEYFQKDEILSHRLKSAEKI